MRNYLMMCAILVIFSSGLFTSCSDNINSSDNPQIPGASTTGSGFFEFSDYAPFNGKIVTVYYYIPLNANPNSKILFVFHGTNRNAKDYRDVMISKANQYGFIIVAPEFSNNYFPGGDAYNLGNVFIDGDNPTPSSLNPENQWTFSVIEPLFDFIKLNLNNTASTYEIFGHSAGGQFAHRFVMFKPNARYNSVVASASGWYTVPDFSTTFPYGFLNSPLESSPLTDLFEKNLIIQVGDLDNDPNASELRHNQYADGQGLNRFDRAQYFYNKALVLSQTNNLPFMWEFSINEGANHDFVDASQHAANLIFN